MSDPFQPHNHAACSQDALATAARLCRERGVRLTALRQQVLALIWRSHQPLGAYALIDALAQDSGKPVAPPTVYRALEFLLAQGLIHRIDSLNAYIGCPQPEQPHVAQFLVCSACGNALECASTGIDRAINRAAGAADFSVDQVSVEISGRCQHCRQETP